MIVKTEREALIEQVCAILPGKDCGLCGYGTCRRFATAVVDHKAPLSGCRQDPLVAHRIADILGVAMHSPHVHGGFHSHTPSLRRQTASVSPGRREVEDMIEEADAVLARIDVLQKRLR